MVPPLDHFQGKNKNCSSLARTISTSRRSFFSNLTTFEWPFGLTIFFILKIAILRKEKIFSPERRSKVVKFAKNDRLDALIVLARDEQFLFFPWKWSKGGTIGWFFHGWNLKILLDFYLFLTQAQSQLQLKLSWSWADSLPCSKSSSHPTWPNLSGIAIAKLSLAPASALLSRLS